MGEYWTINGIEADGLEGTQNGLPSGDSADYSFLFRRRPDWEDATDDHVARYKSAIPGQRAVGTFDSYETINGKWHWREQSEQSPLVHIVPPDDDPVSEQVWGLIEGIDDATVLSEKRCVLSFSVLTISSGDEYETEAELRSDRQRTGP